MRHETAQHAIAHAKALAIAHAKALAIAHAKALATLDFYVRTGKETAGNKRDASA
jgi:hypothetical protein